MLPFEIEHWDGFMAVVYAMALGGAIGAEREMKCRPAGFRTHMLVSGAAAFIVWVGADAVTQLVAQGQGSVGIDTLRLVQAVIAGVSFIGAGTIFAQRQDGVVVGITTAASLLMSASLGIAVGLGYSILALLVTLLSLTVLTVLAWIEKRLRGKSEEEERKVDGV